MKTIEVQNLNDSGVGSLREALRDTEPRIILFNVGGIIKLESRLNIVDNDCVVLGQTALDSGISIYGHSLNIQANNVRVEYLRFRGKKELGSSSDCITINNSNNVVIKNCSMCWSNDELISVTDSNDVSITRCIIAEPLNYENHGYGSLFSNRTETKSKYEIKENLYSTCLSRTPRVSGNVFIDFRKNIIYNCGIPGYSAEDPLVELNLINNYYKHGKLTQDTAHIWRFTSPNGGTVYLNGNSIEGHGYSDEDNFLLIRQPENGIVSEVPLGCAEDDSNIWVGNNWALKDKVGHYELLEDKLDTIGCNRPKYDETDLRIICNFKKNIGDIIDDNNPLDELYNV